MGRVTLILDKLASIDPGGSTINRPINSLRELFLSRHPNNNASLSQRLAVLDLLIEREPEVAWELLIKLIPESGDISHPTSRPRYREAGASEREVLTRSMAFQAAREIIRRALDLVGNDLTHWKVIIPAVSNFDSANRDRTH